MPYRSPTRMLKQFVQAALRPFHVKLTRIPSRTLPQAPFNAFEYVLAKTVRDRADDFRFVQVGANDGVLNDNLGPLIRKYRISGCLVEPMPDVFDRLKANYSDQTQLTFSNCMIGPEDGSGVIHRFKRDAPVPADFYHGLAREDAKYIVNRAAQHGLAEHVEALNCPMLTFATFYAGLGYDTLDLLYVDTEGSDDKVIYQAFSAGVFPKIINYEWTEMSLERQYELKVALIQHGYQFLDVGADSICVRE